MASRKLTKAEKELKLFNKRIGSIYFSMKKRMGGLRFSLPKLREVMVSRLGKPCPYCAVEMRAKIFSVDHILPVSRGGKKNLANLQMVCSPCNRSKADLTDSEYFSLIVFLSGMSEEARRSVMRRLRASPMWMR